jgi:hypothetical protein
MAFRILENYLDKPLLAEEGSPRDKDDMDDADVEMAHALIKHRARKKLAKQTHSVIADLMTSTEDREAETDEAKLALKPAKPTYAVAAEHITFTQTGSQDEAKTALLSRSADSADEAKVITKSAEPTKRIEFNGDFEFEIHEEFDKETKYSEPKFTDEAGYNKRFLVRAETAEATEEVEKDGLEKEGYLLTAKSEPDFVYEYDDNFKITEEPFSEPAETEAKRAITKTTTVDTLDAKAVTSAAAGSSTENKHSENEEPIDGSFMIIEENHDYVAIKYNGKIKNLTKEDLAKAPTVEYEVKFHIPPPSKTKQRIKVVLKVGNVVLSFFTPAMTTFNALVAFTNIDLPNLIAEFDDLSPKAKAIAIANSISSHVINFFSNLENLPGAAKGAIQLITQSDKTRKEKAFIWGLGFSGFISAFSLGKRSASWMGEGAGVSNGLCNAFVTLVTRLNGGVILSNRRNRNLKQGTYKYLLKCLVHDEKAALLLAKKIAESPTHDPFAEPDSNNPFGKFYTTELKEALKDLSKDPNAKISKEATHDFLVLLVNLAQHDADFDINDLPLSERLWTIFDWVLGTLSALSIVPTFAHRFMSGLAEFEILLSGKKGAISNCDDFIKFFAGLIVGAPPSSLMYLNAVSQIRPVARKAWTALTNKDIPRTHKAFLVLVILMTAASGASGYNMIHDVFKDAKHDDFFVEITKPHSPLAEVIALLSALAVALTNGKFAINKATDLITVTPKPQTNQLADDALKAALTTGAAAATATDGAPIVELVADEAKLIEGTCPAAVKALANRIYTSMRGGTNLSEETLEVLQLIQEEKPTQGFSSGMPQTFFFKSAYFLQPKTAQAAVTQTGGEVALSELPSPRSRAALLSLAAS